ncbi:hypothetical protein JTB14_012490 [Gonioctena quinquepunctata]|nr:hypothetical protein JTB14_012490 [Gonioctena quinquepunctata]
MTGPTVTVAEGNLLGTVKSDINGGQFHSFQGIPYAKPPLGDLRFKAPQPPEKWKGIRDATAEGSDCCGRSFDGSFVGSEDCLVLNVFSKEVQGKKLKPVMFWIHGGGFTSSSGHSRLYGPEFLMTEDVVLVTFNYRLGPLGFLRLEDSSLGVPGNAGLKDMVMALKWVQRNIKQFTGDPNNVTIFGESAGGAAVHYLMLSPMAKGLFHKAIAQSGCATNQWARCSNYTLHRLAENLGIYTNDENLSLIYLQNMPVEDLYHGAEKIPDRFLVSLFRPFGPVIEKPSKDAFLAEDPLDIMKLGNYSKVPFMTGCVSREGMFVYALNVKGQKNINIIDESVIPRSMNLRVGSDSYKRAVEEVKSFYFPDKRESSTDLDNIYRLYTDNAFQYEVYKTAERLLESSAAPIYFYRFSLETELNFMKNLYGLAGTGVCHADDIAYLFKSFFTPDIEPNNAEFIGILRMVKLFTNFAKYGNPTPIDHDPILPTRWTPISKNSFGVLDIGRDIRMLSEHPDRPAMEFWDKMHRIKHLSSKL